MATLAYSEALERSLGEIIAEAESRAKERVALIGAQADAKIAEIEARAATAEGRLIGVEAKIEARLIELKDGEPGRDGRDGADGVAGRDGADGRDGRDGVDGRGIEDIDARADDDILELSFVVGDATHRFEIPLVAGKNGADGAAGQDGRDGVDGKDGTDGQRGPEGKQGALSIVREWMDEVHYEGAVVRLEGSTWQASRDTGHAPPHEDWALIAGRGRDGVDGKSFRIRKVYDAASEYQELDVVVLNGAAFVARQDDPGPCPGDGWQLLAGQGKRGVPGERGPAGEKGVKGDAGDPLRAVEIDGEGLLKLVNGDGSAVTCDLYPLLSKIGGK